MQQYKDNYDNNETEDYDDKCDDYDECEVDEEEDDEDVDDDYDDYDEENNDVNGEHNKLFDQEDNGCNNYSPFNDIDDEEFIKIDVNKLKMQNNIKKAKIVVEKF